MTTLLHTPDDHPPGLVLRATLALDFMAFTEFAFGVVRPNTLFKPNGHLEVLAHKLSQVASGEVRRRANAVRGSLFGLAVPIFLLSPINY